MRSVHHLLQFVAGPNDVGLCLLVATEDIRQFRVSPIRDVVVLRVLTPNASLYCVSLILVYENPGLKVVPQNGRDLLNGHLERSFSCKQDMTPSRGSENGSQ